MSPQLTFVRSNGEKLTGELIRENNKTIVLKVPKGNSHKYIKVHKTRIAGVNK